MLKQVQHDKTGYDRDLNLKKMPVIGLQLSSRKIINGTEIKIDFSCSVIFA
jgi:hypothetical protein